MPNIRKNKIKGVRLPAGIFPGSVIAKMINISIPDAINSPTVREENLMRY